MKVLLVGANSNYAIERFYLKYMNDVPGIKAELFEAQNIFLSYWQKSIFNKIVFRLGYQKIYSIINELLKEKIVNSKPDILFVFKGMEVYPKTLIWVKKQGVKLVNYNPDNPFIFSGRGSGNNNLKNSIPLFDMHLTYNREIKERMESVYKIPTEILPFGFDVSAGLFKEACSEKEINKACFLGNPDKYRSLFLQQLAEAGIEVDVYGSNWKKFVRHPKIKIFPPIYNKDLWLTLRKYRVQVNLMRPHNLLSHNMRSFEVPGIGGIQLAPDTPDHRKYFDPGKEIFLYSDVAECARQIVFLQSLSMTEANEIRIQARRRCLQSGYSYKERAEQALGFIEKL